jgi:hypothetical protein
MVTAVPATGVAASIAAATGEASTTAAAVKSTATAAAVTTSTTTVKREGWNGQINSSQAHQKRA